MPLYDYVCDDCGQFRAWQSMAAAHRPASCPTCGEPAVRALSAPHLRCGAAVIRYKAEAHNEKSANEPMVVRRLKPGSGHAEHAAHRHHHHGHRHPRRKKRPWMLGHS
jgi:putative FmdB family regulatory protein